jgi:hypothetical protein
MECHGEIHIMPIKTFRGLIADEKQDTIVLHTNNGATGYRIVRLDIMTNVPHTAGTDTEHIVMVWKVPRSTAQLTDTTTTQPDFSNQELLGAAIALNDVTGSGHGIFEDVIFDNEIFNQDIYVTHRDEGGSTVACNYYIELEQIKLDLNENTVATLKDIRNTTNVN